MDMNTIEAVVRTGDPGEWRNGDAWLAGGTVLFSYGSFAFGKEPLRRLLDLSATDWPALTVTALGHRDRGHVHGCTTVRTAGFGRAGPCCREEPG